MTPKNHSGEHKTDSSMSVGGKKLCTDHECVGQIADVTDSRAQETEEATNDHASGKERQSASSMRAGKHTCVDDQCIGKT